MRNHKIVSKIVYSIMHPIEEKMKLDMFRYGETTIRLKCNSDGALIAERVPYKNQFKTVCGKCKWWGKPEPGFNKAECKNPKQNEMFDYLDMPPMFFENFGCVFFEPCWKVTKFELGG